MRLTAIIFLGLTAAAVAQGRDVPSTPSGEGNPDEIVCRAPQQMPNSRLPGPRVCKTNAVWAQYRKDGMDVAPDGIHDVPSEKYRSSHPMSCRPATAGGGNTSGMNQANMGMICE